MLCPVRRRHPHRAARSSRRRMGEHRSGTLQHVSVACASLTLLLQPAFRAACSAGCRRCDGGSIRRTTAWSAWECDARRACRPAHAAVVGLVAASNVRDHGADQSAGVRQPRAGTNAAHVKPAAHARAVSSATAARHGALSCRRRACYKQCVACGAGAAAFSAASCWSGAASFGAASCGGVRKCAAPMVAAAAAWWRSSATWPGRDVRQRYACHARSASGQLFSGSTSPRTAVCNLGSRRAAAAAGPARGHGCCAAAGAAGAGDAPVGCAGGCVARS
jgi:hypothetical protein